MDETPLGKTGGLSVVENNLTSLFMSHIMYKRGRKEEFA
jgi:hypothetical protein